MKAKITFEDKGAQSIVMHSDITFTEEEAVHDRPTPAVVLAIAAKAMYLNGMLARAGQIAMQGISEGKNPEDCILAAYEEKKNSDTNS